MLLSVRNFRPDVSTALYLPAFWIKFAYPLALFQIGIHALIVVARPGGLPRRNGVYALAMYLSIALLALWQLKTAPSADYPSLIFGGSSWFCSIAIIVVAAPVFLTNIWFLRRSAPTDLGLAGFVAGLTSGAAGALMYSWGCVDDGFPFIAVWYTFGILCCGFIGALLGRHLLRW